jgi:RNA polymerase sigma-70 factor (family 1)
LQENEQNNWALIRMGDKIVFEQVFKQYYQPLCNYAGPMLKDYDEAEEIVQNVFYNIWVKRESIEITSSLKSYLYKAVHNDCLNKLKHLKVRANYATDMRYENEATTHENSGKLIAKELNAQIQSAIDELPEQCGHVFKLSRFEQLKYSEIAEQLGISIKTVENHMGKALRILREKLKDYLPLVMWLLYLN